MRVSRRDFLVKGVQLAAGSLVAAAVTGKAWPAGATLAQERETPRDWTRFWEEHEWAFVVDIRRCIGCGRCVVACKKENGVPLEAEVTRTWVEQYAVAADGRTEVTSPHGGQRGFGEHKVTGEVVRSFFVPKLCNQCEKPPCVKVCPVAATYQTGDGVVLVDQERCIGCRYCIQACPYGARFLHPELRVADKCTWCYHRITKGLLPACVQACPTGARIFGDLKAQSSAVKEILEEQPTGVLKPAMGTEPQVYYLALDRVVI